MVYLLLQVKRLASSDDRRIGPGIKGIGRTLLKAVEDIVQYLLLLIRTYLNVYLSLSEWS